MISLFKRRAPTVVVWFFLLCLLFPGVTYAYIDPGSGSYVFQLIVAALLGLTFATKVYWRKSKAFLSDLFRKKKTKADD